MSVSIPYVIEKTGREERSYDLFSRLLKDRIVFVGSAIDDLVANVVIAQLLFLQMENRSKEISMYVNSPGGSVTAGLAIYDTMQFVQCDIATYCIGQAASMGAILLAAGTSGKRFALPHARVMLHQPWMSNLGGTASDIRIHAEEIMKLKDCVNDILVNHTGQKLEQIAKDTDRDFFMSAEKSKEYGVVDEVLETIPDDESEKK